MKRAPFTVLALVVVTSTFSKEPAPFLAVSIEARPIEYPKIDGLRQEIIATDASLIRAISEAEARLADDVELIHASIVAAQLETDDTAAVYREAKSVIADLDTLRRHLIVDLALPSNYTPPDVPVKAFGGAPTDPKTAFDAISKHLNDLLEVAFKILEVKMLDTQKKIETLSQSHHPAELHPAEVQHLLDQLKALNLQTQQVLNVYTTALNTLANSVVRWAQALP